MGTLKTTNIESISGSGTVTLGTSGETIALGSNVTVTGNGLVGITEADMWRITADAATPTGDITANWERVDTNGQGNLGTGMSESSGIFTFPSTGFWLITAIGNMKFTGGAHDHAQFNIYTTTDDGTYNRAMRASDSSATTNYHASTSGSVLFDVTSTTNCKCKFYSSGDWTLQGNTNENETHTWFLRVGDT